MLHQSMMPLCRGHLAVAGVRGRRGRLLLPFMEETPAYAAYNLTLGAEGRGMKGFFANCTVTGMKVGVLQCPSDRDQGFQFAATFLGGRVTGPWMSRGNYGANWGNRNWEQNNTYSPYYGPFLAPPFGQAGNITLSMVTDGLSGTAFLAEILQGRGGDARGLVWLSMPGSNSYMTVFRPNRFDSIYTLWPPPETPGPSGDYLMAPALCYSEPKLLPCRGDPNSNAWGGYSGERSHHPGGINTLIGDGSVHFIKDTINLRIWIGINSIAGNEVVETDNY